MNNRNDKPWQVLSSKPLLENPWFAVRSRDIRLPSGQVIDFQSIEFPRPSVAIVPRRQGQILLIRQYRVTIDREVWALPSGGVDEGEEPEAAARRELLEETGLKAINMRPLAAYYPSYGASDQLFLTFLADEPVVERDEFDLDEVMETRWFSREEIMDMLFRNDMVDGLSLAPLALLFLEDAERAKESGRSLKGTLG